MAPHRHHRQTIPSQSERFLVVRGVRPGVREHQLRQAEGDLIDGTDRRGLGAAAAHQPAVSRKGIQEARPRGSKTRRAWRKAAKSRPNGTRKWPG